MLMAPLATVKEPLDFATLSAAWRPVRLWSMMNEGLREVADMMLVRVDYHTSVQLTAL
jgi:hypothetical protein